MLPVRISENEQYLESLPIILHTFPIEVLSMDDDFILSGALDDLNDVRQPDWRSNTSKLSYRGTFTVMGQIGVGTQWGVRNVITNNLWNYLKSKFGMQDGEYYLFTNALPTFSQTTKIKSFAVAMREQKERLKNEAAGE